jgi:hypothetical protein
MDGGDGTAVDGGDGAAVDGGDGIAVDGGDGAEQTRLWCSGGASRGEATAMAQSSDDCGATAVRAEAAARPRTAREDNGGAGRRGGAWWKMNREERRKI